MEENLKQLLLKDLCARLPYGVNVLDDMGRTYKLQLGNAYLIDLFYGNGDYVEAPIRPYLRQMLSITEEEKKELKADTCPEGTGYFDEKYLICPMSHYGEQISYDFMSVILEWLNSRHFDYCGLIEKGLALEAPEGMYK